MNMHEERGKIGNDKFVKKIKKNFNWKKKKKKKKKNQTKQNSSKLNSHTQQRKNKV